MLSIEITRECPLSCPGLALRAVVGFVLAADDALYRRSALGAGLAELAVHCHVGVKGRDLFGEGVARLSAQSLDPLRENIASHLASMDVNPLLA